MPAVEHHFSESPPAGLYLDTNVLVAFLVSTHPHHLPCRAFLNHLADYDVTVLCLSSLSWIDYAYVFTRAAFRASLPATWQRRYRLTRWQDAPVRQAYLEAMLALLQQVLDQFEWDEIALTPQVLIEALRLMSRYNLNGQDAVHLASARLAGVTDLASLDEAFRRVDGLHLWNDVVHSAG